RGSSLRLAGPARVVAVVEGGRGRETTRHAFAAPSRLGSIQALVRPPHPWRERVSRPRPPSTTATTRAGVTVFGAPWRSRIDCVDHAAPSAARAARRFAIA